MPHAPRDAPRLASDIVRSWLAATVAIAALAVAVGVVLFVDLGVPRDEAARMPLYVAWCALVVAMIALTFVVFTRASAADLRAWLIETREPDGRLDRLWWSLNGGGAIWWAITGAGITMYTLVGLAVQPTVPSPGLLVLGAAVVVASYAMVVVSFAVHYARVDARHGGFSFPGSDSARFIDYVYLSTQVSTTFASSDVELTASRSRRAVTLHSLISMTFNTVLVSLFVSALLRAATPAA